MVIGSLLLIDLVVTDDLHVLNWITGLMRGGLQAFRSRGASEQNGRNELVNDKHSEILSIAHLGSKQQCSPFNKSVENRSYSRLLHCSDKVLPVLPAKVNGSKRRNYAPCLP